MKSVLTLVMICFFTYKSHALSEDNKPASGAGPKVRISNAITIVDPPLITAENNKLIYCEGKFIKLTATGGDGTYQWYRDEVLIENITANQLAVDKAGKYRVTSINIKSNALIITMSPKLSKPNITFND